jgi:hypothetical protein
VPRRRWWLPTVLVGSGIFFLVLAFLCPLVVYPKLAVLPLDPQAQQIAHGTGFNVFLPRSYTQGGIHIYRDVGVTSNVFVSAAPDPAGPRPSDSPNAVWRVATSTSVDGHGLLQTTVEVISLNRHTSRASNCCGDALITQQGDTVGTPMIHKGYVFMFPFDVQKHAYPVWDANIDNTVNANYVDTEKRRGLKVYKFVQVVPNQKISTYDLPGSLYGLKKPVVTADMMYQTRRTYWISPASGGIVDYQETMNRTFRYDGKTLPVIQGTLNLVKSDHDATFKLLKTAAFGLPLLHHTLPWTLGPLGVLLVLAGLLLGVRQSRTDGWDDWDEDDWNEDDEEDEKPRLRVVPDLDDEAPAPARLDWSWAHRDREKTTS